VSRVAGGAALSAIIATGLATAIRFASRAANFASAMVLDKGKSQGFFAIVKGVQDRVVRCTKCRIRRGPEGGQEDGLQDVFHRKVTDEAHGVVKFGDRGEVKIDGTRVVCIPAHHANKFTSKQSSLHALVVKRKDSKKSFPYLLCTKWLRGDVVLEHFEVISERGPEFLKTAIEDVFKRVAIPFVRVHPGSFFSIIDSELGLSNESAGECAAREQPPELYAKEQKEAEDVTRKVFVRLDCAASPSGIVGLNKIASVPRASTIVVVAKSETVARTGATTGSLSGRSIFLVRHVCAAASETREIDVSPAVCDRKRAPRAETRPPRSDRSNMQ
jgi:hypothetical protein